MGSPASADDASGAQGRGEDVCGLCGGHRAHRQPRNRRDQEVQIFVAVLGASSYTYVEAQPSQGLEHWIGGHVRALAFFDGVPLVVVPDNLKSGVKHPCCYEPDLNPSYQELARHYGCAVIPTRVRKPRDKGRYTELDAVGEFLNSWRQQDRIKR